MCLPLHPPTTDWLRRLLANTIQLTPATRYHCDHLPAWTLSNVATMTGFTDKPHAYAWKVPSGGERNQNAMCYYAGAWMAQDIKGNPAAGLKHVEESQIRDGSVPQIQPVGVTTDADWTDTAHVPAQRPELAHINHPREGDVISSTSFPLHFVNPTSQTVTDKIRLLFMPTSDINTPLDTSAVELEGGIQSVELETMGNQYKGKVDRPAELTPGPYTLIAQMLLDGKYVDKARVSVEMA